MWPTTNPWLPPEKRPSVISATLSPRPRPITADVGPSIERLRKAIQATRFSFEGKQVRVTISLGVAHLFVFEPAYTGISRFLAAGSGERSVMSLNETAHLRDSRAQRPVR